MIFGNQKLPEGTPERPLVTFALFACNQQEYVRDAVLGAFSQTYSPLEIVISDDHSKDETYEIILEEASKYRGQHKVVVNRNKTNLGLIGHVNKIFEIASGELIVAAAGDDISLPIRTERICSEYINRGKPLLIHTKALEMGQTGTLTGRQLPPHYLRTKPDLARAALAQSLYLGATGAWHRSLFDKYGPIKYCHAYEDLVLGFRAVIENKIEFIDEPLIKYRTGSGMTTKRQKVSSLSTYLKRRIKGLRVSVDVQKQRLDDWIKSGVTDPAVTKLIKHSVLKYDVRLKIIEHTGDIPGSMLKSPIQTLRGIASETLGLLTEAAGKRIRKLRSRP